MATVIDGFSVSDGQPPEVERVQREIERERGRERDKERHQEEREYERAVDYRKREGEVVS